MTRERITTEEEDNTGIELKMVNDERMYHDGRR